MKRMCLAAFMAALILSAAVPVLADDESGWRVRVDFAIVDPSDSIWSGVAGGTGRADFDTGAGVGVRGEYQLSRRLGVDFGFLSTASVGVSASAVGTSLVDVNTFTPITVGVDVHLTPDAAVDLYAGPQLAWVEYGDVEIGAGVGFAASSISIGSDLGLGAILGLDVPIGEKRHWAFQTNLRYFSTSMDEIDVDFDPAIFSLGFGYRR